LRFELGLGLALEFGYWLGFIGLKYGLGLGLMVNRVEVWVRVGVRDWLGVWVGVRVKVGFRVRVGIVRRSEGDLFN